MQNKAICFCERQDVVGKTLIKLEKFLISLGKFDFSYQTCSVLPDCLSFSLEAKNDQICIIVCENKYIDKIVEQLKVDEEISLINDQAVVLSKEGHKMIFIPLEVSFEEILLQVLQKEKVFTCSVFGKNLEYVQEQFKKLNVDVKILSKTAFLHVVYYKNYVDQEKIKDAFGKNVFVFEDKDIEEVCARIIQEKNLTISFADCSVFGKIGESFLTVAKNAQFVKQVNVMIAQQGCNKEDAFALAKKVLTESGAELSLVILGQKSQETQCFVAVGNKDEIHVSASVFSGEKLEIMENAKDFAFFKLLSFLKEKY